MSEKKITLKLLGSSSINIAAENGHKEIVEILIENGIDVNVRDNAG